MRLLRVIGLTSLSRVSVKAGGQGTEMARPWIRRIGSIGIAIAVLIVTALALLWETWVLDAQPVVAIAVLGLVPLATVIAAAWWLWWRLPGRQVRRLNIQIHDPKAHADTEREGGVMRVLVVGSARLTLA
jgi:hypothetical protein